MSLVVSRRCETTEVSKRLNQKQDASVRGDGAEWVPESRGFHLQGLSPISVFTSTFRWMKTITSFTLIQIVKVQIVLLIRIYLTISREVSSISGCSNIVYFAASFTKISVGLCLVRISHRTTPQLLQKSVIFHFSVPN